LIESLFQINIKYYSKEHSIVKFTVIKFVLLYEVVTWCYCGSAIQKCRTI